MELWIRSQDKEKIVKCNDLAIKTESEDGKTIKGYSIVGYFDKETEYEELGLYSSKNQALNILDEIQAVLNKPRMMVQQVFVKNEFTGKYNWEEQVRPIYQTSIVYEMP